MTTPTDTPGVVFSRDGAVSKLKHGKLIRYRRVGGIFYHVATADAVVQALEQARSTRRRIRVYLGDTKTGRDWLEEHHVEGHVSSSLGPLKVPLLCYNQRSRGGPALLDHCIVKLKWTAGGVLYQHPHYHTGHFMIRLIGPDEIFHGSNLCAEGYTHAVAVDGRCQANFRSARAAERYVRRLRT